MTEAKSANSRRPVIFLETSKQAASDYEQSSRAPLREVLMRRGISFETLDPTTSDVDIKTILEAKKYRTLVTDRITADPAMLRLSKPKRYTKILFLGLHYSVDDLQAAIQCGADAFLERGYKNPDDIEEALLNRRRVKKRIYGSNRD